MWMCACMYTHFGCELKFVEKNHSHCEEIKILILLLFFFGFALFLFSVDFFDFFV